MYISAAQYHNVDIHITHILSGMVTVSDIIIYACTKSISNIWLHTAQAITQ